MAPTTEEAPRARCATERGASAVEYALLIGFIAAVIILAVSALGVNVADMFDLDLSP